MILTIYRVGEYQHNIYVPAELVKILGKKLVFSEIEQFKQLWIRSADENDINNVTTLADTRNVGNIKLKTEIMYIGDNRRFEITPTECFYMVDLTKPIKRE